VRREHHGGVLLRRIVSIRHGAPCLGVLGSPLPGATGPLDQLPVVAEQVLEVAIVPLGRVRGPGALKAAGDRVGTLAALESVPPTEALLLKAAALGIGTAVFLRTGGTMGLAKGMAPGNQRDSLLVVHGHA